MLILADGITISIGDRVWSFGPDFILYLVVAAIVGIIAEMIVGWRIPSVRKCVGAYFRRAS